MDDGTVVRLRTVATRKGEIKKPQKVVGIPKKEQNAHGERRPEETIWVKREQE